jgi:hypothetical protein
MQIPNLPTDNLYKFMTILGMILFAFFFTFPIVYDDDLTKQIFQMKADSSKLDAEVTFLTQDLQELNSSIDTIDTINITKGSEIFKEFVRNDNKRKIDIDGLLDRKDLVFNKIYDSNYREAMKFLYEYYDYLFPEIKKHNDQIKLKDLLYAKTKEVYFKNAELNVKEMHINELLRKESYLFKMTKILCYISSFIIIIGLFLWFRFQRKVDKKLILEIEVLKKSKDELTLPTSK